MSIYSYITIILLVTLPTAIDIYMETKQSTSHNNISNKSNYIDANDAGSLAYMGTMQHELLSMANPYCSMYSLPHQHSEMGPIYGGSSLSPTVANSNTIASITEAYNKASTDRKGSHIAKCQYCGNKTDNLFKCNSCGGPIE